MLRDEVAAMKKREKLNPEEKLRVYLDTIAVKERELEEKKRLVQQLREKDRALAVAVRNKYNISSDNESTSAHINASVGGTFAACSWKFLNTTHFFCSTFICHSYHRCLSTVCCY